MAKNELFKIRKEGIFRESTPREKELIEEWLKSNEPKKVGYLMSIDEYSMSVSKTKIDKGEVINE